MASILSQLLNLGQGGNNLYTGLLGELWTIWQGNVSRAVLLARWYWNQLPEELIDQAAAVQQQAQAAQSTRQINDQVNTQLGMLGIFPGSGGGPSFSPPGIDPDHAMFVSVMGMIRLHKGEPPATPGLRRSSEAVLRGQLDPVQAMVASAPPQDQPQVAAAVQMFQMIGMNQFLQVQAFVQAASSLPRERIPIFLPEVET
jgi:hypothetical protein